MHKRIQPTTLAEIDRTNHLYTVRFLHEYHEFIMMLTCKLERKFERKLQKMHDYYNLKNIYYYLRKSIHIDAFPLKNRRTKDVRLRLNQSVSQGEKHK